jgi:nickel transport system substrate-binding protein
LQNGACTILHTGIGRLDPHTYRPNEFFASNWIYDGLVEYGAGGAVLPSLAASWTVADTAAPGKGKTYTFNLRQGVTFHDGAAWNCSVAKLNFDHVMASPLTTGDYHGWYGLPQQLASWSCTSNFVLVVVTKEKYYPLMQELSFIRPLRMASPNMFVGGLASDPLKQNSCHKGWGNITDSGVTVQCAGMGGGGITANGTAFGTGRWKYSKTEKGGDGKITKVHFAIHADHWDAPSGNHVNELVIVHYPTHDAVKTALLDGSLDAVLGAGVLTEEDVAAMRTSNTDKVSVVLTEAIQNRIIVLNTAKAPTDKLQMRKVIIHAVDRDAIIKKELAGLAEAAESLFPKDTPYCGAHLTPRPDYDIEKAKMLNCPTPATQVYVTKEVTKQVTKEKNEMPAGAIAAIGILGVAAFAGVLMLVVMYRREKAGDPMFKQLLMQVEPIAQP